ncbi:MAG: MotA/TolQ/ExbB proton channel family protein [Pseudomonadota bacterium]
MSTASTLGVGTTAPTSPSGEVDRQPAGGWFALLGAEDPALHSYLLALRFLAVNLVAFVLVGAAWFQGWIAQLMASDSTHLLAAITAVFLVGLALCGRAVFQVSDELNQVRAAQPRPGSRVQRYLQSTAGRDGQSRAILVSALKLKLASRIAPVRHIANSLVILGLVGTVLGFIIALAGVDPETAADVSSIGPMVSTLIDGMSVALYTTLLGAVLNVWLMLDYRILEGGTIRLLTAIVERGEHGEQL